MQCLFLLNITLKNDRLYLLTGLALHIDRLHRKTARDTEGEVKEKVRGRGWGEAHSCTFIEPKIPDGVKKKEEKKGSILKCGKNYPEVWKIKWVKHI